VAVASAHAGEERRIEKLTAPAHSAIDGTDWFRQLRGVSSELLKHIALPLALFAVLFGMGLSLVPADFPRVVLQPKAKLIGLGCQLLLLPAVAFLLA